MGACQLSQLPIHLNPIETSWSCHVGEYSRSILLRMEGVFHLAAATADRQCKSTLHYRTGYFIPSQYRTPGPIVGAFCA